jgi:TonB-linked SusC/RagA family outer membrane protein
VEQNLDFDKIYLPKTFICMRTKLLRKTVLKVSGFALIGLMLQCFLYTVILANTGNAQSKSIDEIHVAIDLENLSIEEVFQRIEKLTDFQFAYKKGIIDQKKRFSRHTTYLTLGNLLRHIAQNTDLAFLRVDEVIHVKKQEKGYSNVVEKELSLQNIAITGNVTTAETGESLPGVSVVEKGTTNGTITDLNGFFNLNVREGATLVMSFVGYQTMEVEVGNRSVINAEMIVDVQQLEEIVVVGYGVQRRSDITGSVASVSQERLEMVPNLNIAQAIQGSVPGVMIQTSSAGAAPSQVIMVRGRNSILASNDPLIVVDGVPYGGSIADINPGDVKSIEILKDASAAAIYGSRGANGVILVTTKQGRDGEVSISYNGYYSFQNYVNLPEILDGKEFYEDYKMVRIPEMMSEEERAIYEAGTWLNWYDLIMRTGKAQQHNLSLSGGSKNTSFYIAGGLLDVKGLTLNDNYLRINNRINVDTEFRNLIKVGTRTQFTYADQSGVGPSWSNAFSMNPLSEAYDEHGNILLYPWAGNPYFANPLQGLLYKNINESYQLLTNNFAQIDVPFVQGLSYRINTGFRFRFVDFAEYRGMDTKSGYDARGRSDNRRTKSTNMVVENILSFNRDIGRHTIFATALYSYEGNNSTRNRLEAMAYPNDFLSWYASPQAESLMPEFTYDNTELVSQMLRLNYSYDSRYLLTLTMRRDGYSGFGAATKWGIFPSVALGWNLANEEFFPWGDLFSELKPRISYGMNGNQAVNAYETISRLEEYNMIDRKVTQPGYRPSKLGQDNLGWESSRTLNIGLDYGFLANRIRGDINVYKTNTSDLLLNRTISPVHGLPEITQNIGETENKGIEFTLNSRNISTPRFNWITTGNMAYVRNKIVSLYGILDEDGREVDDILNKWFIGKPIRVNYDFKWLGVWQLDEAEEATKWNSQPGFVKLQDVNGDYVLDSEDLQIIGQQDPKFLWGINNSFSYSRFRFDVFIHGIHGITRHNTLMREDGTAEARQNTMKKNWWRPDNPTNDWVANHLQALVMGGSTANYYQNASFVRVKDISISYDFPDRIKEKFGNVRLYLTGRNLFTFTKWIGLDPELSSQTSTPLQKEYVIGANLTF